MENLVAIMEALGTRLDQLHLTLHASHPEGDHVREAKELAISAIVLARQIQRKHPQGSGLSSAVLSGRKQTSTLMSAMGGKQTFSR